MSRNTYGMTTAERAMIDGMRDIIDRQAARIKELEAQIEKLREKASREDDK